MIKGNLKHATQVHQQLQQDQQQLQLQLQPLQPPQQQQQPQLLLLVQLPVRMITHSSLTLENATSLLMTMFYGPLQMHLASQKEDI